MERYTPTTPRSHREAHSNGKPSILNGATLPRLKNLSAVMAVYRQGIEDLRKEILTSGLKDEYALEFLRNEDRFSRLADRMAENFGEDERGVRRAIQEFRRCREFMRSPKSCRENNNK